MASELTERAENENGAEAADIACKKKKNYKV